MSRVPAPLALASLAVLALSGCSPHLVFTTEGDGLTTAEGTLEEMTKGAGTDKLLGVVVHDGKVDSVDYPDGDRVVTLIKGGQPRPKNRWAGQHATFTVQPGQLAPLVEGATKAAGCPVAGATVELKAIGFGGPYLQVQCAGSGGRTKLFSTDFTPWSMGNPSELPAAKDALAKLAKGAPQQVALVNLRAQQPGSVSAVFVDGDRRTEVRLAPDLPSARPAGSDADEKAGAPFALSKVTAEAVVGCAAQVTKQVGLSEWSVDVAVPPGGGEPRMTWMFSGGAGRKVVTTLDCKPAG